MSIAEVVVRKSFGSHTWVNTHAIQIGADAAAAPSDADLVTAGAAAAFGPGTTAATGVADILHAIVAFERLMHFDAVNITNVLVTDGKRNSGPTPSTIYASIPMNIPCSVADPNAAPYEPGSITLLLHRQVVGFSHKPGRMFLRAALNNTQVSLAGSRMLAFAGTTAADIQTRLTAALNSGLTQYMNGGANAATAQYVLPLYITPRMFALAPTGPKVGTLYGVRPIANLTVVGPVDRQVQRGRKRKKV